MINETTHSAEFLVSEGAGKISREQVTILSGEDLAAGTVLGKITASGKYKAYNNGAGDGSQTAAGVLYSACDATGGDKEAVAIVRLAEVSSELLTGSDANAVTDLASAMVIVR